jgi:hypothetical protein
LIDQAWNWLNQDPIGEEGGLNLYQFVYNNPINLIDSDGREVGFNYGPGTMENVFTRIFNPPQDPGDAANQWIGYTDYSFFNPLEEPKWYFSGIKCNKFVGDCISECPSRPKPLIKDPNSKKYRYPLAREWADPSIEIPGYGPPHKNPQPGDVVTDSHHLGFMTPAGYVEAPTHGAVKLLPFNNPKWNPGIGRSPIGGR